MDKSPASEHRPETSGRTIHWARFYDVATNLLFLGKESAVREMTLDLARVAPGEVILDIGCGTGSLTLAAKKRAGPSAEVHGVDASPEMIAAARRKAAKIDPRVDFQVGLVEDIPLGDDRFDLVLSSLMLHHLPPELKRSGLAEIHRVLRPGGRFLAVDFEPPSHPVLRNLGNLLFGHQMMISDLREVGAMMEEAGFIEIEQGRTRFKALAFLRGRTE